MLDPQKEKLIAQAKAELEEVLDDLIRTKGRSFTNADLKAALDAYAQRGLRDAQPANEVGRRHTTTNDGRRGTPCVRITPIVAADYQARNVFSDLRAPIGKAPGRYFVDHDVSRTVAQAVFDDAVEQAARGGSLERRSLTLAYNTLARRTIRNFGDELSRFDPGADVRDPNHFMEQAPIVDALLRTVSQPPYGKPRRSQKKGN